MNTTTLAKPALALCLLVLGAASAAAMGGNLATKGETILKEKCARCHAVAADDASKNAKASALRDVAVSYGDDLAAKVANGIDTKHQGLPAFKFEPMESKGIVDYLEKLRSHLEKK